MIERVFRTADTFTDADRLDREDVGALSFEERISGVERFGGHGSVKVELNQDWTELLSALIARRVRFVLVGGHAVAGHAEPRFTDDLDVFVDPTLTNAKRLRAALVDFGFGPVAPPAAVLAAPDKVFMLGRKPSRIDVHRPAELVVVDLQK